MSDNLSVQKIDVKIVGLADLLFHRFIDHSKGIRPPEQKLYLDKDNRVVMPGANIESFLFRQLAPVGCALAFEGRQGKTYRAVGTAHVFVDNSLIQVTRHGKELVYHAIDEDGIYIVHGAGITRMSGGGAIKQEDNPRPCISLPWEMEFSLTLISNPHINETRLFNWFTLGGIQLGIGNWRPRYGRFAVDSWEVK